MRPDMMVMAKGMTSGYAALGATLVSERVWEPFWADGTSSHFLHGLTYSGHSSACAAALANLDILESEKLVERVRSLESVLHATVAPFAEHPLVKEVRSGIGLLAGIQMHDAQRADAVCEAAIAQGILMRQLHGATLQVSPPFVVEESEIAEIGRVLGESLDAAL
jgi:adenosylmethionine-8-amino-7-oxononanoate aminotransferase